jgi:hypothetical protein
MLTAPYPRKCYFAPSSRDESCEVALGFVSLENVTSVLETVAAHDTEHQTRRPLDESSSTFVVACAEHLVVSQHP